MISRLVVIGYGNMASALVSNFLEHQRLQALTIIARRPPSLSKKLHAKVDRVSVIPSDQMADIEDDLETVVLLAVKPHHLADVHQRLRDSLGGYQQTVLLSVLAGVALEQLTALFAPDQAPAIVRSMPNMAALVGHGATVSVANRVLPPPILTNIELLFRASGPHIWLEKQEQMDSVTAISGSAPAYFFALAEALASAGVANGLTEALSARLAGQALIGAGMLMNHQPDPSRWRQRITSPGGTTQAALAELARGDFNQLIARVVEAARSRGAELARLAGESQK